MIYVVFETNSVLCFFETHQAIHEHRPRNNDGYPSSGFYDKFVFAFHRQSVDDVERIRKYKHRTKQTRGHYDSVVDLGTVSWHPSFRRLSLFGFFCPYSKNFREFLDLFFRQFFRELHTKLNEQIARIGVSHHS